MTDTVLVTGSVDDVYAQVQVNGQLVATVPSIFGNAFSVTISVPSDGVVRVEAADLFGNRAVPVEVGIHANTGFTKLSVSGAHVCVIKNSGLRCYGENGAGQVGNGTTVTLNTIYDIIPSGVSDVVASIYHTCAIVNSGVKCWGRNSSGELGNDSTLGASLPVEVNNITGASSLSLGFYHSCTIVSGAVKCWGNNMYGQLGDGTLNNSSTPVQVVGLESGVKSITSGWYHSCAILTDNTVKCWGLNSHGQLGTGGFSPSGSEKTALNAAAIGVVKSISAGFYQTCFVNEEDNLKCLGFNGNGNFGNGTVYDHSLSPQSCIGLDNNVKSVSTSMLTTCARTLDGKGYCWGSNAYWGLGINGISESLVPLLNQGLSDTLKQVAMGVQLNCAITNDSVKCWGLNAGQPDPSNPSRMIYYSTPAVFNF